MRPTSSACSPTPRSCVTAARSRRRSRTRARPSRYARRSRWPSSSGPLRQSVTTRRAALRTGTPRPPSRRHFPSGSSGPASASSARRRSTPRCRRVGSSTTTWSAAGCGRPSRRSADVRPDRSGRFPVNRGKEVVRRWRLQVRAVEVPARRGVSPGPDGESPSQRGGLALTRRLDRPEAPLRSPSW